MRRHNRLLFRVARGAGVDDAEAQDVVQETYLRAFGHLHSYRGDAALGTRLARIAINVATDLRRRAGRIVALDDLPAPLDEESPKTPLSADAPDRQVDRAQLRALLQSAIESLPPIYRSVFMLRAVEEMSVEQAAYASPSARTSRTRVTAPT